MHHVFLYLVTTSALLNLVLILLSAVFTGHLMEFNPQPTAWQAEIVSLHFSYSFLTINNNKNSQL